MAMNSSNHSVRSFYRKLIDSLIISERFRYANRRTNSFSTHLNTKLSTPLQSKMKHFSNYLGRFCPFRLLTPSKLLMVCQDWLSGQSLPLLLAAHFLCTCRTPQCRSLVCSIRRLFLSSSASAFSVTWKQNQFSTNLNIKVSTPMQSNI